MREKALILFAHGARDPRWAEPFQRLQAMTRKAQPSIRVELAFLDLMTPTLPTLVKQLVEEHVLDITIAPVFLGQGGHVLTDLPNMVMTLRTSYPQLKLKQLEAVGEDSLVLAAIRDCCLRGL